MDPKLQIEKITRQIRNPSNAAYLEQLEHGEKLDNIHSRLDKPLEVSVNNHPKAVEKMKVEIEGAEIVTIKGKQGDKGETGERGPQGESVVGPQGPAGIQGEIGPMGPQGIPGRDADEQTIIQAVLSKIPKPKDGRDGKDGKDGIVRTEVIIKETLKHLSSLKGNDRPSLKMFREADDLIGSVALHKNMLHNMPKSLIDGDQRWGGHGGSSGGGVWTSGSFTGDNNTTIFTLPSIPASILFLFINGQRQLSPSDFSLTGATITFTSAPLSADLITYDFQ
jgi:hypothetical protein